MSIGTARACHSSSYRSPWYPVIRVDEAWLAFVLGAAHSHRR